MSNNDTPAQRQIYKHEFSKKDVPDPASLKLAAAPPPWRKFMEKSDTPKMVKSRVMDSENDFKGRNYIIDEKEAKIVNAALVLRRPILITGQTGIGKTTLAYSVAWQLGLGNVLKWSITSRSTLKDALYQYDALARLHDASLRAKGEKVDNHKIGNYFTLGPLGTAFLPTKAEYYFPRVLLIDEIDKSDIDLPNDLLHIMEEGRFSIPEIARMPKEHKKNKIYARTCEPHSAKVRLPPDGEIQCDDFPLIIMTSNGERDFPPAFLRRCLQLDITWEKREKRLPAIIGRQLGISTLKKDPEINDLLKVFNDLRTRKDAVLSIDQLMNAVFLVRSSVDLNPLKHEIIKETILRSLDDSGPKAR